MTEVEQAVWAEWNALPEYEENAVPKIAAALDMERADVAAIVFPEELFGPWSDDDEEPVPTCAAPGCENPVERHEDPEDRVIDWALEIVSVTDFVAGELGVDREEALKIALTAALAASNGGVR